MPLGCSEDCKKCKEDEKDCKDEDCGECKKDCKENNDGRKSCRWCGAPTKKVYSIFEEYDVCTKCGR